MLVDPIMSVVEAVVQASTPREMMPVPMLHKEKVEGVVIPLQQATMMCSGRLELLNPTSRSRSYRVGRAI